MASTVHVFNSSVPLYPERNSLHAPVSSHRRIQFSVYVNVFSICVWFAIAISLAVLIFYAAVIMRVRNCSFGDLWHVGVMGGAPERLLFLAACLQTCLLYAFFCSTVTATMTSGASSTAEVRSFEDAFKQGLKI